LSCISPAKPVITAEELRPEKTFVQVGSVLIIRSVIFNILFYLNLVVLIIAALPTLVMPRAAILAVARFWARTNLWLLRAICGITVEYRGLEKIPRGALIVACKHQSLWETFALLPLLSDPAYIMKRELMWIPFFGWYTWKARMIAVDRSKGSQALADMNACVARELARNRQIIIFPEGTRRAPGAEPHYKYGVVHLYLETGVACLPIALNSGLFWPRRSVLRYPGTIRVEVLDPIPQGLSKVAFFELLQREIEAATTRLVNVGERELANAGIGEQTAVIRNDARRPATGDPKKSALEEQRVTPDGL
jgi:1-acyl-sn-glycerol-3-phosphate acyltransferase